MRPGTLRLNGNDSRHRRDESRPAGRGRGGDGRWCGEQGEHGDYFVSREEHGEDATAREVSAGGGAGSYSGEYGRLFADVRPRKACACSNSPASGHEVPVTAHATGDVTLVTRGGRPVLQLAARDN